MADVGTAVRNWYIPTTQLGTPNLCVNVSIFRDYP